MQNPTQLKEFCKLFALRVCQTALVITALLLVSLHVNQAEKFIFGPHNGGGFSYKRIPEFVNLQSPPDLLFLGSSTCSYAFDRKTLIQSNFQEAFNLSSNGQTIVVSEALLTSAIQQNLTPKILVLDINPKFWNKDKSESLLVLAGNSNCLLPLPLLQEYLSIKEPFLLLNAVYFMVKAHLEIPSYYTETKREWEYQGAGFRFYPLPPNSGNSPCLHTTYFLNHDNEKALRSIQKICEDHQIILVLTTPPRNPNCRPTIPKLPVEMEERLISGDEWPNSGIDTMYCDAIHLRGAAASNYTNWFLQELHGVLRRD